MEAYTAKQHNGKLQGKKLRNGSRHRAYNLLIFDRLQKERAFDVVFHLHEAVIALPDRRRIRKRTNDRINLNAEDMAFDDPGNYENIIIFEAYPPNGVKDKLAWLHNSAKAGISFSDSTMPASAEAVV
ncbi:MAG: hypothetical protein Q9170_005525 [Blastenia crenularia]